MGVVYIVYDHESQEYLAAKTFQDRIFAHNPVVADRFLGEALSWLKLDSHENISGLRFVEMIDGKPYLFLEYVDGGDLGDWIGTPQLTDSLSQVLLFAVQFCHGMVFALDKGITAHRDIKPRNCLITSSGVLKIADFGLAKVFAGTAAGSESDLETSSEKVQSAERPILWFGQTGQAGKKAESSAKSICDNQDLILGLTPSGLAAGTPAYMAPEQFEDAKHVNVRADIYSFGVMLYQMVTGKLPFVGGTWEDYKSLHKSEPPPHLDAHLHDLDEIIQKCVAKNTWDRYGEFGEVRSELRNVYVRVTGKWPPLPPTEDRVPPNIWVSKGESLAKLGRNDEALRFLDRAVQIDSANARAWSKKGVVLVGLKRTDEALLCFDRAVNLNTNDRDAFVHRANILSDLGRLAEAAISYERAIELGSNSAEIWKRMGAIQKQQGRTSEAIECFDRALSIDSHDEQLLTEKGLALMELRRHKDAIRCFDQVLLSNPNAAPALRGKALELVELGQSKAALPLIDRLLVDYPQDRELFATKGRALRDLGRLEEAFSVTSRAVALDQSEEQQGWQDRTREMRAAWHQSAVQLRRRGRQSHRWQVAVFCLIAVLMAVVLYTLWVEFHK